MSPGPSLLSSEEVVTTSYLLGLMDFQWNLVTLQVMSERDT